MAITNDYCTLANLKAPDRLNITDTNSDTLLEGVIEAVSRWIDNKTRRFFYTVALSARYYTAFDFETVYTDDISTATGLTIATDENVDGVYEIAWESTDYNLKPYNPLSGWPYQSIETIVNPRYVFPRTKRAVKVTATWGWASVPREIEEACLLQSERLFKRFSTPLGSSGMSAVGEIRLQIPNADGDVLSLLQPYTRFN